MILLRGDLTAIATVLKSCPDGDWNVLVSTERKAHELAGAVSKKNRYQTRDGMIVIEGAKRTINISYRLKDLSKRAEFLALDVDFIEASELEEWPDAPVKYLFCMIGDRAPRSESRAKKDPITARQFCIKLIPVLALLLFLAFIPSALYLRIKGK